MSRLRNRLYDDPGIRPETRNRLWDDLPDELQSLVYQKTTDWWAKGRVLTSDYVLHNYGQDYAGPLVNLGEAREERARSIAQRIAQTVTIGAIAVGLPLVDQSTRQAYQFGYDYGYQFASYQLDKWLAPWVGVDSKKATVNEWPDTQKAQILQSVAQTGDPVQQTVYNAKQQTPR